MLICSKPIGLTCGRGMTTLSDSFGERLRANYAIMPAAFAPRDLLHLLTGSDEMPPAGGSMTSIAVDSRVQNTQNLIVGVVNNIVNRVLLEDRSSLTYQDRVYIETALHKLGIENAALFVSQIRQLRHESAGVTRLLNLYRDNFSALSTLLRESSVQTQRLSAPAPDESERGEGARLYMHNEIFRRLKSADIYSLFSSFSRSAINPVQIIDRRELAAAEPSRTATALTLNEYKTRLLGAQNLELAHVTNRYELGDLLPPPRSEGQVVAQASASALLNLIGNVYQTRIQNYLSKRDLWLDLRSAVSRSAQNSLSRFISYHSEGTVYHAENRVDSRRTTELFSAEADILSRFVTQITQNRPHFSRSSSVRQEVGLNLTHIDSTARSDSRSDIYSQTSQTGGSVTEGDILNITRQILGGAPSPAARPDKRQAAASQETADAPRAAPPSDAAADALSPAALVQALTRLTRAQSLSLSQSSITRAFTQEGDLYLRAIRETALLSEAAPAREGDSVTSILNQTTVRPQTDIENAGITHVKAAEGIATPPVERIIPAEGEGGETVMRAALDEINRQNRERYERIVRASVERRERQTAPTPDRKRILRDALRAIESPEQALKSAFEAAPTESPRPAPEIEAALQGADETTRQIYQTLIEYHRDPERLIASGAVRPAEALELNLEAERVMRERAEMEHLIGLQTSEIRSERLETERLLHRAAGIAPSPDGAPRTENGRREPVQIVHRTSESRLSEEDIRLLERQNTERTVETERRETVQETTERQTLVNRQVEQITAKTAEDVTELINRTLARQIGAISDSVYSRLERKLQNERARRGRY